MCQVLLYRIKKCSRKILSRLKTLSRPYGYYEGERQKAKPSTLKHRDREAKGVKFAMNKNDTAVDREKAETTFNATSEYKIGHTTYTVTTVFNPASKESLSEIMKRLIIRESEKLLGESGQEPEKQAV